MAKMTIDELFKMLWKEYTRICPDADPIRRLLSKQDGADIVNDHVAFRTYNIEPVGLASFETAIGKLGYARKGEYMFKEKKLRAFHFEAGDEHPKVFVSELLVENFSPSFQKTVKRMVERVDSELEGSLKLFLADRPWPMVYYDEYQELLSESEYGAWLAAFGLRANHFTVAVHKMKSIASIEDVVKILQSAGFAMNTSGGLIKGTKADCLLQASTLGSKIEWSFAGEEKHIIPGCYYEFAERLRQADGTLYGGFVEKSADKIFESTNVKRSGYSK